MKLLVPGIVILALCGCKGAGAPNADLVGRWKWDWKATSSAMLTRETVRKESGVETEGELVLAADGTGQYFHSSMPSTWSVKGDSVVLDQANSPLYKTMKAKLSATPRYITLTISKDRQTLTERRPPAGPQGMEIVNVFRKS